VPLAVQVRPSRKGLDSFREVGFGSGNVPHVTLPCPSRKAEHASRCRTLSACILSKAMLVHDEGFVPSSDLIRPHAPAHGRCAPGPPARRTPRGGAAPPQPSVEWVFDPLLPDQVAKRIFRRRCTAASGFMRLGHAHLRGSSVSVPGKRNGRVTASGIRNVCVGDPGSCSAPSD